MPDEKLPDSVLRKAGVKVSFDIDTLGTDSVTVVLSPEEKAKRLADSLEKAKIAYADSILKAKEEAKAKRDSIRQSTPRVLMTFSLPDSLQHKRIIKWNVGQDFHDLKVSTIDTSYNYHYNDYPFFKKDVNASWLGVAGSPAQTYNYFRRDDTDEGVEFYRANEMWSCSPRNFDQYNSKTAHTELAYWGTLFAGHQKESNNIHILTTQNITPELNFMISYDKFGGKGILQREETANRNFKVGLNYLGKNYMMNAGYVFNKVTEQENGGISELSQIRDTTIDAREVDVRLHNAESKVEKHTVFLDQQFRIPFDFINRIKEKKDTTFKAPEFDKNITSAFIGHSSELDIYTRLYNDQISPESSTDRYARQMYSNPEGLYQTYIDPTTSRDSTRALKLDNKVFLRLQPWKSDAAVSKIDVGVGDLFMNYAYGDRRNVRLGDENSFYVYAGAKGQYKNYINWDAIFHYNLIGARMGDFDVSANASFNFFPFRKARKSPLSLNVNFTQTLRQPTFYQEHFYSNHYAWDNSFKKASVTRVDGTVAIPHWKLNFGAGYALLANNVYYDSFGLPQQNTAPMSVVSAWLNKEFVLFKMLHLDNRLLFQTSSRPEILPLPTLALNLRWFVQFNVKKDAEGHPIMQMQIGFNGLYNTPWYAPSWNPATATFRNQRETLYMNGPMFDVFVNVQWKRACIFVKFENVGQGWPLNKGKDYFASDRHIVTQRGFKFGIFWPFYLQPNRNRKISFGETVSNRNGGENSGDTGAGSMMPSGLSPLSTNQGRRQ